MRRRLVLGLVAALALAACEQPGPVVTLAPPASATPAATASAGPSTSPAPPLPVDATLLKLLPPTVDGVALKESSDGEAELMTNAAVAAIGRAVGSALAVDPATSDFVLVQMVRLVPAVMTEDRFRDWRETFDQGVCSNAGGLAGSAGSSVGGRQVWIGTCVGGVRTYHLWLTDQDVLISASAAGDRHFGELLMAGIKP